MSIKITNETKTGVLVLVCLVALGALIVKVGNFTLGKHGYTVRAQFHFSGGVKKHAPVCLSGVEVGEVKDIRMIYGDDVLVELDLWIQDGVKIRKDSTAISTLLGLMGEKYIEIRSGSATSGYAVDGDLIQSKDPMRLEDLIEIATKVAGDIGKMANDISDLARNVNGVVDDNKPKLARTFDNLEETSENFRDFSQDIKFHPWKVLMHGREASKEEMARERAARLAKRNPAAAQEIESTLPAAAQKPAMKSNFSHR